jgi:hypothetical protein
MKIDSNKKQYLHIWHDCETSEDYVEQQGGFAKTLDEAVARYRDFVDYERFEYITTIMLSTDLDENGIGFYRCVNIEPISEEWHGDEDSKGHYTLWRD